MVSNQVRTARRWPEAFWLAWLLHAFKRLEIEAVARPNDTGRHLGLIPAGFLCWRRPTAAGHAREVQRTEARCTAPPGGPSARALGR